MMDAKFMNEEKNESGQALIELIIFLPMMFTIYFLVSGFASAIYGSINQQKITRSYFYFRAQNNSNIPKPDYPDQIYKNWNKFGMFFIGWKLKFTAGETPVMPCYKVSIPLKPDSRDKCEEKYSGTSSQFIRVGTVYGVCGATYGQVGNSVVMYPNGDQGSYQLVVDKESCLIR